MSSGVVLGSAAVFCVSGLGVGAGFGAGLGLGFSTKATRVRAAGAWLGSVTAVAPAGAGMVRVCMGPVRSVWGLLSCQSSVPARLSSTTRCSANTSAPQHSKLRVLGRSGRCASGSGGWGGVGCTGFMGSHDVGQRCWHEEAVNANPQGAALRRRANPGRPTVDAQMHAAAEPRGRASRRRRWPTTPATPRPRPSARLHRTRAHTGLKCPAAAH